MAFLVSDAIRAIRADEGERLLAGWRERGVHIVSAADVLAGRGLDRYLPAGV